MMNKIENLIEKNFSRINKIESHFSENDICLVTGAGGSIGGEIAMQLAFSKIKRLYLIDISEFNLFSIYSKLEDLSKRGKINVEVIPILQDVKDVELLSMNLSGIRFNYVFHAAAYKHVNLIEKNKHAGLKNNIMATKVILEFLKDNFERFILISTDKAVEPENFMGLSKKYCENIALNFETKEQIINIVRFGNVLHSSGSVIPIFEEQINNNGPVTVTDKNATRYFMTIPEAVSLVLKCSQIELNKKIFVLDMGEAIKILDLAKHMIRMNGKSFTYQEPKDNEIKIEFIGIRKGEKIEEKLSSTGKLVSSGVEGIFVSDENSESDEKTQEIIKYLNNNLSEVDLNKIIKE